MLQQTITSGTRVQRRGIYGMHAAKGPTESLASQGASTGLGTSPEKGGGLARPYAAEGPKSLDQTEESQSAFGVATRQGRAKEPRLDWGIESISVGGRRCNTPRKGQGA